MGKVSVEQRALQSMALFEQSGRPVCSLTIKGQEITFKFQGEDAEPANSLDKLMELKAVNAKN
tara:strand:+ start:41 stop:229 length:189 start_codon:yes stop_codon:yes gene_type:complete